MDPFELHPKDKERMSEKKENQTISVNDVKKIIANRMSLIKNEASPMWGYNIEHIGSFFYELIKEIEHTAGEKDDS